MKKRENCVPYKITSISTNAFKFSWFVNKKCNYFFIVECVGWAPKRAKGVCGGGNCLMSVEVGGGVDGDTKEYNQTDW